MQTVKHDWQYKLLSLVAAVGLAFLVYRQAEVQTTLLLPVNITPPPGQRVLEPSSSFRIWVDLKGPNEVLRRIQSDDVRLNFDLSNVKTGERTVVPVSVELPEEYRNRVSMDWRPQSMAVKLVADASKQFAPLIKPLNEPEGWGWVDPPRASPGRVTVRGSSGAVNRVAQVAAPFAVEPGERVNTLVSLQALDEEGNNITDEVQLEPAQVVVTGTLQRVVIRKRVPVQPMFDAPAGHQISVDVTPSLVRVIGAERAVSGIYVVETEPVRLPPGQLQVSREVPLVHPAEGVQLSPERVRVTLRAQPEAKPEPAPSNRPPG